MAKQPRTSDHTSPDWPTSCMRRLPDGRLQGVDRSVWLYRAVPLGPVVDATDPLQSLEPGYPVQAAFEELAALTPTRLANRRASQQNYRQIHALLINVPMPYRVPGHPLQSYLEGNFARATVKRRFLLLGVKLRDSVFTGDGLIAATRRVAEVALTGAVPLSAYDADYEAVDAALTRAGLATASMADLRFADSWWNFGDFADTPLLPHAGHMHVFRSVAAAEAAKRAGAADCSRWPDDLTDHHALSASSVEDFELAGAGRGGVGLRFPPAVSSDARWVHRLVDTGAVCVSIRGLVEPSVVTRQELRRRRKQYLTDVQERVNAGVMHRAEQDEIARDLEYVESEYATSAPPTLIETSVLALFDGRLANVREIVKDSMTLSEMTNRQHQAFYETMLCSPVRANPHLHDIPAHTLAFSGLPSLSIVGDDTGAQVGFTERDRQVAFLHPSAASNGDALPILLGVGQVGSGKTVLMLWLADQISRLPNSAGERTPVIVIDPKQGSDHSDAVRHSGGHVYSLDSIQHADGSFDPIRFSPSPEDGLSLAASMLLQMNPWGPDREAYEQPLLKALKFGMVNGARCTGQALQIARSAASDDAAVRRMIDQVLALADVLPMFSACVGTDPTAPPLSVSQGITLIKAGDAYVDFGDPKSVETPTLPQRITRALIRAMVYGSAMAVANRQGVVMLDEAWVVLSAGANEVERLGRLARSQQVLPMLFTQRVSDALNAGLAGYISRGLILPTADPDEARAACQLFKLEPTPERMARITGKDSTGAAANWGSMRALRDPVTGQVLRGAVAIYADLRGRAVPVEVSIPADFFRLASTNPEDIRRRRAQSSAARLQTIA